MAIEIEVQAGGRMVQAVPAGRAELITERCGMPGRLTFSALAEGMEAVKEGGCTTMQLDGARIFQGYIFSIAEEGDGLLRLTAYDQLRYLKNRDSYVFPDATAAEIVRMIGGDYGIRLGEICDTGHVIPAHVEDNAGLMDMMQSAIDATLAATRELYVLYDDCGRLTLRNVQSMQVGMMIDGESCTGYSQSSSIDSQCYNRVKLLCEDAEQGRRLFISGDGARQEEWGTLQYFERIGDAGGAQARADALLALYCDRACSLKVDLALNDARLRAGCVVPVQLETGRGRISGMMLVEKCRQIFEKGSGRTELTLRGI